MNHVIKTDVGVVRSENQDNAALFKQGKQTLAVLCDGMGGHTGGTHASRITIDTFEKAFKKEIPTKQINNWIVKTITKSKEEMTSFAKKDKKLMDMGTTLTISLIDDENIYIFNIGDSRTYVYNGLLHQVTKDHNLRNYYIAKYDYSPEDAAKVPAAAALTSALGPTKQSTIDSFQIERDSSTKYVVLTSDGIHDYITKPFFEKVLSNNKNIDKKATKIINQAISGKSSDNLTIIIVDLGDE